MEGALCTDSPMRETGTALQRIRNTRTSLQNQLNDIDKLIDLLEKNPEIETILTLARRFV